MKTRTASLLLAALLGLTQCKKQGAEPQEQLPEATQTGQNSAGCRVDGQLWLPRHNGTTISGNPIPAVSAVWRKAPTGAHPLALSFSKYIDQEHAHNQTGVFLYLPNITQPGTFVLDQAANPQVVNGPTAYAAFTFYRPSPDQELLSGPAAPGRLVVTRLDTVARIVSGTFEFTARQASGGPTVRVSEGRFDCKF